MRSPPRLPGSAPNEILAGTEVATGLLLGVLALRICAQELAQRRQAPIPHLLDPGDPRRHIPKRIDRQLIALLAAVLANCDETAVLEDAQVPADGLAGDRQIPRQRRRRNCPRWCC